MPKPETVAGFIAEAVFFFALACILPYAFLFLKSAFIQIIVAIFG